MRRILPLLLALCLLLTGCHLITQPAAPNEEIVEFTLVTDPVQPAETAHAQTPAEQPETPAEQPETPAEEPAQEPPTEEPSVLPEDGRYTTKDDVAA